MSNVTICGPGETKEIYSKALGIRWCFTCRGRHNFTYTVRDSIEPSYWGPMPAVRCDNCRAIDGDCGFGSGREYE